MAETQSVRRPSDARSHAESVSAQEYITQQLQLEQEAREALPYQFDTCTKPLGPLRQSLFSCLTCNPPDATSYVPAGICYSCSISCHGEHELVELFAKRDFECDCGTSRMPDSAPCTLRISPKTGSKGGVTQDVARPGNKYNHNFAGRFCSCDEVYDPSKEKGTMFQCLGLGHLDTGGCGEDWYHPECLVGIPRPSKVSEEKPTVEGAQESADAAATATTTDGAQADEAPATEAEEAPLPPGFPAEDEFDHFICHRCVEANAWLKPYAGSEGFLPPVAAEQKSAKESDHVIDAVDKAEAKVKAEPAAAGVKRSLDEAEELPEAKRSKTDEASDAVPVDSATTSQQEPTKDDAPKHSTLSDSQSSPFSLFLKEDFREHLCHCASCFPRLRPHPQLLELEDTYEPPVSASSVDEQGQGSVGSRSLLDRGEAALSTMDRMRAIEGVMAYNHLRDKVKAFLAPFAESGQAVGAEDVKAYFARLRGDEDAIRAAAGAAGGAADSGDGRREQGGY